MVISFEVFPSDQNQIFAIELPGIISSDGQLTNIHERFNTKALFHSFSSTETNPIVDYWSSSHHHQKPILQGNILTCKKLVLRFRRDRRGNVSVCVVGIIRKICIFRNLADFSLLQHEFSSQNYSLSQIPSLAQTLDFKQIEKCVEIYFDEGENQKLEQFLPILPRFSQYDSSLNFEQRRYSKNSASGKRNPDVSLFERASWVVSYSSEEPIPMECTIPTPIEGVPKEFISKLKILLENKPIWTRIGLMYELKKNFFRNDLNALLRKALPYLCYNYSKGPWRRCWVRYGFDPRIHPEARFFQTVILRNVYWNRAEATSNVIQSLSCFSADCQHIFDGCTVSNNLSTFQLCDILENDCRLLIESTSISSQSPREKDGWYPDGFILKLRFLLSKKFECLLKDINWTYKPRKTQFTLSQSAAEKTLSQITPEKAGKNADSLEENEEFLGNNSTETSDMLSSDEFSLLDDVENE